MEDLQHIVTNKEPTRPYLPFLAAQEEGIVDLDQLQPQDLSQPLGVMLQNGRMPAVDEAGLIRLGDEVYAVDHVYVKRADAKELRIGPANKGDVNSKGDILDTGLIVLTRTSDFLHILLGKAVTGNVAPWISSSKTIGGAAIRLYGIDAPRVIEPKVVEEGNIVAKFWTP